MRQSFKNSVPIVFRNPDSSTRRVLCPTNPSPFKPTSISNSYALVRARWPIQSYGRFGKAAKFMCSPCESWEAAEGMLRHAVRGGASGVAAKEGSLVAATPFLSDNNETSNA